jgi:hypothetical protein
MLVSRIWSTDTSMTVAVMAHLRVSLSAGSLATGSADAMVDETSSSARARLGGHAGG